MALTLSPYQAAVEAVARARRGEGPTLLAQSPTALKGNMQVSRGLSRTIRSCGVAHERSYPRFRNYLVENEKASQLMDAIDAEIKQEWPMRSSYPGESCAGPATALDYIYAYVQERKRQQQSEIQPFGSNWRLCRPI
jgi:TPP-dependent pyruvate/acetoin dehydrogenase alpha subunit